MQPLQVFVGTGCAVTMHFTDVADADFSCATCYSVQCAPATLHVMHMQLTIASELVVTLLC